MKRKLVKLYFLFGLLVAINAQTNSVKIDELIQRYVDLGQFSGSVLIAENDEIILKKGYGLADREWNISNTPETKFRIGSVTKQFTSMLIFMLYEEGKIKLDGKLYDYLPYYRKDTGEKITISQLLNHTSGIPSYTNTDNFFQATGKLKAVPKDFIIEHCSGDLEFEPGSKWVYNNSAYFILGAIIEKVTGLTYEQALTNMIFEPLGMNNSGVDNHLTIIKKRAAGYRKTFLFPQNDDFVDMTTPYAAGAIYSTVEDLYKWDRALYTNKLISDETMKLMLTPVSNGYANGWSVQSMKFDNGDSVVAYHHSGGINGFTSLIYRIPEKKQLAIAVANIIPGSVREIVTGSLNIINGDEADFPKTSLSLLLAQKLKDDIEFDSYSFFQKLKETDDYENFPGYEWELNRFGYELLENGYIETSLKIFKINTELYPESFNVYDSMGEALVRAGKNEEAIASYQKALELNPNLISSIDALKELGVNIKAPEKIKLTDDEIKLISGKYELSPSFIISIYNQQDKIMAKASGQPAIEITPASVTSFYNNQIPIQIEFVKNDSGVIESLNLFQNGQKIPGKKID